MCVCKNLPVLCSRIKREIPSCDVPGRESVMRRARNEGYADARVTAFRWLEKRFIRTHASLVMVTTVWIMSSLSLLTNDTSDGNANPDRWSFPSCTATLNLNV